MLAEDVNFLLPGSIFGQGSVAESRMPATALPGGGTTISPTGEIGSVNRTAQGAGEWGPKMPLNKIPKAEEGIQKAKDATKLPDSFLGLDNTVWKEVFVYGGLFILFLIGIVSLLASSGAVSVPAPIKVAAKAVGG